ncbi:hypothetical protein WJX81_004626 [Elliptochloris bilobata]|uniref:Uncharacterized protein n=1 Tax=Elliptochloris bilobata TaxID=381761 RepID=A0AAW1RX52_9CHLO
MACRNLSQLTSVFKGRVALFARAASSSAHAPPPLNGAGPTPTSMTSFSDPVYDMMSQPYERPPKRSVAASKASLPPQRTAHSHNSFADTVYDYMHCPPKLEPPPKRSP